MKLSQRMRKREAKAHIHTQTYPIMQGYECFMFTNLNYSVLIYTFPEHTQIACTRGGGGGQIKVNLFQICTRTKIGK